MEDTFETEPVNHSPLINSRRWIFLGLLAIGVLVVGAVITNKLRGSTLEQGSRALIDAFSTSRPIEPRLSGGFKSGRFNPAISERSTTNAEKLATAGDLIRDSLAKGNSAAELPYARLLLLSGDQGITEALKYLHRAVASAPASPEAHNDLGVCLVQQNKLEEAITEFEVALERKSEMPEALFNRALCYQRLLLREPARNDFSRAAAVERDRGWLDEINRRTGELSGTPETRNPEASPVAEFDAAVGAGRIDEAMQLLERNSESLRRHGLWDLTIQYLHSIQEGDRPQAERDLFALELIGNLLVKKMNDAIVADVVSYLRSLPASESRTELSLITDYVETSRKKPSDETNAIFERLENQFRSRGNSVFEALSAFRVADYYYASKRFKESLDKLKRLLSFVESRSWPFDRARFLNELALETSRLGQDSLAIKYFEQALALCGESPELESRILQYMSVPFARLGDSDAALMRLRESTRPFFENALRSGTLANLAYNYSQMADIYSLRNQHALALLYADQALSYATKAENHEYAAELSSFVAVENARLSRAESAEVNLKQALESLDKIEPGRIHDLSKVRVLINAIEVATRNGNVQRALEYYAVAEGLAAREEGNNLLTIDLLRARANSYLASAQNDLARSDLERAVSEIERYRTNITTSDQRSHFLDASHSVFDQLISLNAGSPDRWAEAFEMSEHSRARALLEEISHSAVASAGRAAGFSGQDSSTGAAPAIPIALVRVRSALPDDLLVLEYSVTSKGTYIFLITRSGLSVATSPATTETLDRLVRDYVSALRNIAPIDEVNEIARELYDYLIKPVEQEFNGGLNLCIVPDKALHFLPFAGLVDGAGQYLFKSHRLSYAPSASVLIRCLEENAPMLEGKPEKMLAVGNPKFDRELFQQLLPLDDAEREADQSSKFYAAGSVTLVGADATEPRVRSAMRDCDVAHLAVHCLVDETSPWLAALVLAGTQKAQVPGHEQAAFATPVSGAATKATITRSAVLSKALPQEPVADPNDGLLYLNELYGMKLPHTRLVVLSACQSGLGQYYRGEGIASLVRPLLAAGVPTVVASLWPVDSKATSDLMIEFHKQRKLTAGVSAAEALRRAQMELAQTYNHPFYWAPFIVVGAGSASR